MGTIITENPEVKRFWGGIERGISYQITIDDKFTILTEAQFVEWVKTIIEKVEIE